MMLEMVLVSGMAAAFAVAVLREFPTPAWVDELASAAVCAVSVRLLSGDWLPVQSMAAMFTAAILGLAVRRMSAPSMAATRRNLRSQVPPL